MLYYTLIPSRLVAVDEIAPEPEEDVLSACTSPRAIAIGDTLDLWNCPKEIDCVLDGRISLVGVSACGEVQPAHIEGFGSEKVASRGWMVESILSLDQLLGPEASAIRRIVSTPLGVNQACDYDDEVADIEQLDEKMSELVQAATDALHRADIDGAWWAEQVGDTGYELLALAASGVVAESSPWNMRTLQQLMRPWARVKGWPQLTS